MAVQSGMGTAGIVAVPIPPGGNANDVLTKDSATNYDYSWQPAAGGGAPTNAEYVVLSLDATLSDERVLTAGTAINIVDGGANGPVTINVVEGSIDHGGLAGLGDDDHLQYLLLAGRAGGQTAFGGTAASEILTLQGSSAANRGEVNLNGRVELDFDWTTDVGSYAMTWATTIAASGAVIPGMIARAQNVTITAGTFITSTVDDFSVFNQSVAPGFAVNTLFFARPLYQTTTVGVAPTQAFIYAAQAQYDNFGGGVLPAIANYRGLSFAPIMRARNAGDDIRITNTNGLTVQPLYNTNNATATVDYGTITGVSMLNAGTILFGQALGSEIADNWIGLEVGALTGLVVSGERIAVRSAIPASGTSNWVIRNTGGAPSEFGLGGAHFGDNTPVQFGGAIFNSQDASIFWDGTSLDFFFAQNSDTLALNNPNNGQLLFDTGANEMTFNTTRGIAWGDQTGTLGNSYFNFVQGAITAPVAGEFAGVLLTQSGSYTNNGFAMSRVTAWSINGLSYANSSGTVTESDTLTVGGMVTSSPGVTITNRQSLHVIAGRSTFDSAMAYDEITPATLAAGTTQNYAGLLTGTANNGMRHVVRLSGDGAGTSAIGGIDTTEAQDDCFKLINVSANNVTLNHQDAGSTAANRIISPTGANYVLGPDESCEIWRDITTDRWRILYGTGA